MENRPYTGFYASFLGGFSLTYGGEEIVMYRAPRNIVEKTCGNGEREE